MKRKGLLSLSHNPSTGPGMKNRMGYWEGDLMKESALLIIQGLNKPIDHHGAPLKHDAKTENPSFLFCLVLLKLKLLEISSG